MAARPPGSPSASPAAASKPPPAPKAKPRNRQRKTGLLQAMVLRPCGILGRTLLLLLPLLAIGIGLLYMRLGHSPISVALLADPIERGLNAELPGFTFDIGGAILQRAENGGIEFRLKDVRMRDDGGREVAVAKFASVELNLRALLSLSVAPSRVDLIEPRFLLFHDEQGHLALKTAAPAAARPDAGPAPDAALPKPAAPVAPKEAAPADAPAHGQKLEVARLLAESLARMRRDGRAASYLQDFGLRNATVVIDDGDRQIVWRIPELDMDLQHKEKRSIILARARLASGGEPWRLAVRAENSEKTRTIVVSTEFSEMVPHRLAQQMPQLAMLEAIDAPISGKATLEMTLEGEISSAHFHMDVAHGALQMPWLGRGQIALDSGMLEMRYRRDTNEIDLLPSTLSLDAGHVTLKGQAVPVDSAVSRQVWKFDLEAIDGALRPIQPGAQPIAIETLVARGKFDRDTGHAGLDHLTFKVGGAEITMTSPATAADQSADRVLEGRLSPMPVATLMALWPAEVAPRSRAFAVAGLRKGEIKSGSFRVGGTDPGVNGRAISVAIEASDVEVEAAKGLPPLEIPRALLRVEGSSLEITVPDATLTTGPNRKLALRAGRFTSVDIDGANPTAEIAARLQGPLGSVVELLDRDPLRAMHGVTFPPAVEGKIDATLRAAFPLHDGLSVADLRLETKARITDGRLKGFIGSHDLSGATISLEGTEKVIDIKGEMLLAGIIAKLQGRWAAGQSDPKTPLAKISLRLDDADRGQLGMDLDKLVRGEVPIELMFVKPAPEAPVRMQVNADLTPADLEIDELNWRKAPGRPGRLVFDVGKPPSGKGLELQNFKLDAENIAIDGWVSIGPDNKVREFLFPEFQINVVSSLEVQGTLKPDRIWDVKVRGKSPFDAGDVLRAMMTPNPGAPKPVGKTKPGSDLSIEFDTVLGLNDTRLRQVRLKIQKRNDLLAGVDLRSQLDNGRPLTASLRAQPGRDRVLRVETTDAGGALKLIGFYQNMVGGEGVLELNLDGRGAAEKQGQVLINNFRVLGDPIASEVFQSPDESRPLIAQGRPGERRVVREQFDFEQLFAVFSAGNGQVVIDNAIARGPLVGASLRGKLDFRSRRLQLGGTYVPLSGLNRAFSDIPLLGPLLTGPKGEGILGITFAVNGPMAQPQVIVNPFSPLAVGALREIMQMTPENISITPGAEAPRKAPSKGAGPQIRASPPAAAPNAAAPRAEPEVLDGWSTTSKGTPAGKR